MPVPIPKRGEPSKNSETEDTEETPISSTSPPPPLNTTPIMVGYNRHSASNQPDTYTVSSGYLSDPLSQGRMTSGIPITIDYIYPYHTSLIVSFETKICFKLFSNIFFLEGKSESNFFFII